MAHFLTKSKILLVFILLLNTVISFGNNQNKIHSLQTSFSYCMYQNYNNGKAITINYHFPVSNWLSTTSAVTIADGKPKGVSIEESYDYCALNIGF